MNFTPKLVNRIPLILTMCISGLYLIMYFWIALMRIRYPFELEWLEGGMLDQVARIISGNGNLYIEPSLSFTPFIYSPLYFYLSAIFTKFFGLSFIPLRLVSFLSSLASLVIIYKIVLNETNDHFAGFIAAGLFAATFQACGAWFDIARVDSLFLALLLLGIFLISSKKTWVAYLLAGLAFSASFLTKQTALFMCIPILFVFSCLNWKKSLIVITPFMAVLLVSTWLFNRISNGWYAYYIFEIPRNHELMTGMLVKFWKEDMLDVLPISIILTAGFFLIGLKSTSIRKTAVFWLSATFFLVISSYLARLNWGGYLNVLMPAYAVLSITTGISIHTFEKWSREHIRLKYFQFSWIFFPLAIQFALLVYNPLAQIPKNSDLEAGKALVECLTTINGNIYMPYHEYLLGIVGHETNAHYMALLDVMHSDKYYNKKLKQELEDALEKQEFEFIILDDKKSIPSEALSILEEKYELIEPVFENKNTFYPVTGARTRPSLIYLNPNYSGQICLPLVK